MERLPGRSRFLALPWGKYAGPPDLILQREYSSSGSTSNWKYFLKALESPCCAVLISPSVQHFCNDIICHNRTPETSSLSPHLDCKATTSQQVTTDFLTQTTGKRRKKRTTDSGCALLRASFPGVSSLRIRNASFLQAAQTGDIFCPYDLPALR